VKDDTVFIRRGRPAASTTASTPHDLDEIVRATKGGDPGAVNAMTAPFGLTREKTS